MSYLKVAANLSLKASYVAARRWRGALSQPTMPKKGGAAPTGDKRLGFFAAIEKQKLETVRWSMLHGGQFVSTRNDDNETCLHVCAQDGKDRALGEILEILGRQNSRRGGSSRSEAGEAVDGLELTNDEGMTPLMLAARRGSKSCLELLVKAGAKVNNVVRTQPIPCPRNNRAHPLTSSGLSAAEP